MPVPKSVTRVSRDGRVTYTQSVDRVNYTIRELTRAALRDVGNYVCREFRKSFYKHFKRHSGRVFKYTQKWVKHKVKYDPVVNVEVGVKPNGFYGAFQEFGTSETPRLELLTHAVMDNIPKIIEIESQYLSALEDEARALSLISEEDYEGNADE